MQLDESGNRKEASKRQEVYSFLLLTVVLAPVVAITVVGGLGLLIWIFQMIAGPPGPPS